MSEPEEIDVPPVLPVLPLKDTVVFPQSTAPLAIGQERSVRLGAEACAGDRTLALITSRDAELDVPGWDEIHAVGTAAVIHKMMKVEDGTLRILVQGLHRIRLDQRAQEQPYLVGAFSQVPDVLTESREVEALT